MQYSVLYVFFVLDSTPDIIEGPFEEEQSTITDGPMSVDIGTPVNVVVGNDVIIRCNVYSGMYPFTTSWLRNGVSYGRENSSVVVIDDARNGDVFSCKAENCKAFDIKNTTINVFGK